LAHAARNMWNGFEVEGIVRLVPTVFAIAFRLSVAPVSPFRAARTLLRRHHRSAARSNLIFRRRRGRFSSRVISRWGGERGRHGPSDPNKAPLRPAPFTIVTRSYRPATSGMLSYRSRRPRHRVALAGSRHRSTHHHSPNPPLRSPVWARSGERLG